MTLLTIDPRSPASTTATVDVLAPRPATLAGQTLGVIANGLGRSIMMFERLAALLAEREDLADAVTVVKPGVAVPPYPEQWQEITRQATVAVTGFGGCGSCSTRSLRDALDLEAAGIPAVCLVHEALVPAVRAIAKFNGVPGYPIVTVGYPFDPIGSWTKEEASELAEWFAGPVRERLSQS